jgi:Tol biopolymer transport system component
MASGTVRPIASGPETRWATPAWRRDGAAVIAAAATGDGPFNLHEIDLASLRTRQLTYTTGGATWPDVSPDGALVVYVGYTAGGFDLFQMPYPVATSSSPFLGASNDRAAGTSDLAAPAIPAAPSRRGRPWRRHHGYHRRGH